MGSLENVFRDLAKEECVPDEKRKKVGNYLLGRTLGDGAFGKVRLGTHVLAREKVAVKVITKKAILLRDYLKKNLRREALVLQRVSHPNITHLYEVMETENGYYMVLELATGGRFVKYLSARKKLDEAETRGFMRQLVSAVDHIHQSGIIHRDLKLDNVLLDENMNIKLIDFGLSNFCQEGELLSTQCGSPAFTAPEVLSQKKYGPAVDIWTLGVDMYMMLTGKIPFETTSPSNLTKLYAAMLRGCTIPDTLSTGCQDLVRRMLDPRESSRITLSEIIYNSWLTENSRLPVERRPPKSPGAMKDVSDIVVEFILKFIKLSENEVRLAIHSPKANSIAAMHDLLKLRLQKNLGFPLRLSETSTTTNSPSEQNGDETVLRNDILSSVHNINDTEHVIFCTECQKEASTILLTERSDEPNHIRQPESTELCFKCGKVLDNDNADTFLEEVLQCQKLFPVFQEMPYVSENGKGRSRKSSACSDIVTMLNDVDEETFERALKLLRGYGSLPDPPTPPNSAYERHRNSQQIRGSLSSSQNGGQYISQKDLSKGSISETRTSMPYPDEILNYRNRKPGKGAILNVLPPIETPAGGRSPVLNGRSSGLPQLNSLGSTFDRKRQQKAMDTTPRRSLAGITENISSKNNTVRSNYRPTFPSEREDKNQHSNYQLPVVRYGSDDNSHVRHSLESNMPPRPKKLSLLKQAKDMHYEYRKTARGKIDNFSSNKEY